MREGKLPIRTSFSQLERKTGVASPRVKLTVRAFSRKKKTKKDIAICHAAALPFT